MSFVISLFNAYINMNLFKKIFSKIIYIIIIISCVSVYAHKDTKITLDNYELIGLPDKYKPSYLNMKEKFLRIGHNRLDFPSCVLKYFPENKEYNLFITSSWYHDLSLMPPYLNISIFLKNKDYRFNLLFNMDTLMPYQFEIIIRDSDKTTYFHELKIDNSCLEDIKNSTKEIK